MKLFLPALAASVMLLAISCKHNIETEEAKAEAIQIQADVPFTDTSSEQNRQWPEKNSGKDWDKKIIKTAVINVETEEYKNYHRYQLIVLIVISDIQKKIVPYHVYFAIMLRMQQKLIIL